MIRDTTFCFYCERFERYGWDACKGYITTRTQIWPDERTNTANGLFCCTTKLVALLSFCSIDTTGTLLSAVGVHSQGRCNGRAGREDIVSESIDYHHEHTLLLACDFLRSDLIT